MAIIEPLHQLTLAVLYAKKSPCTRYQIMVEVNEATVEINHPYSPGALYHAVGKLAKEGMIVYNHGLVSITSLGRSLLFEALLHGELPSSIAGLLSYIFSILLTRDKEIKGKGLHRITIEMIKFTQDAGLSDTEESMSAALKSCRHFMNLAIKRFVLDLSAQF